MKKLNNLVLPEAVADMLADEILEASDEEITEMTKEIFGDVDEHTEKTRTLIKNSVMKSRKSKLHHAQKMLHILPSNSQSPSVLQLPPGEKKNLINKIKESQKSLTLAARNAEDVSDSDADSLLQDFIDLGVLDEEGNIIK